VPQIDGGSAGWCMATARSTSRGGIETCSDPTTSTGPILAETCGRSETATYIYLLTRSEVAAVIVARGRPIFTHTNPTLPDGLRAAAIAVQGREGMPSSSIGPRCPKVVPLNAEGMVIRRQGKPGKRLDVGLLGRQPWTAHLDPVSESCAAPAYELRSACRLPPMPPPGVCELTAARLPAGMTARRGMVASRIVAYPNLVGNAFLSCVDTEYSNLEENAFESAVLLDASHPGATPPSLPAMKPIVGHPGIYEAPGFEGEIVARRIPGAWLVVEEGGGIGLGIPIELLESLRVTINDALIERSSVADTDCDTIVATAVWTHG
jgi:hypothetical protein